MFICLFGYIRKRHKLSPKLQTTSAVQATTTAPVCVLHIIKEREVGFLGHVTHVTREITRFEASSQLACNLFSTSPAFDTLTQVCDQVFDQVCSWLE